MSKQKKWEVERQMRRHWHQLERARDKGHRDADGRHMSNWQPGELVRREPSRRKENAEQRRVELANQEMITRLHGILHGTRAATGTGAGGAKAGSKSRRDQEEADYLRRRGYRARVLREVRASRDRAVREGAAEERRRVQQVGARVPSPQRLQQEYSALQATHKKMHDFQVPHTAFHLHLPRGGQHAHHSSMRRNQRSTGGSPQGKGAAATGGTATGGLPGWYREAHQEARGMRLSASAPAASFAKFSRRAPPSAGASPKLGWDSGAGDDKRARPQSAAPRARTGTGSRPSMQRRPYSAHRVTDCPEKRDEYMSASEDDEDEDEDGPDWLAYSEQEVREGLLGVAAAPEKQRRQQHEDSPVRPRAEQELPERELTEAQLQQAARHGQLGGLLSSRSQHWAALLAEPSCRVRCSLLSELPSARVALPVPANPDQQPPFSPSRSPQCRRHRAVFSVALFDLGLVCAPALLQPAPAPPEPSQEAVAATAGILVECRLQHGGGAGGTSGEDIVTHSLLVPLAQLQSACEAGGSGGETASTASLSRKLLRLRAVNRPRRLFTPLGGPHGLGAEGLEQLCNFVTDNLQVRVQELQEEQDGQGTPLSRKRHHARTEVVLSLCGAD